MIVEDNFINQNILKRYLDRRGYEYVIASDGHEAIDFFDSGKFDLIFMDLVMPNVDGFEATRKIREKENALKANVATPIIGLSGNAREENWDEAIRSGINDFIFKPIKSTDIYALIDKGAGSKAEKSSLLYKSHI